MHRRTLLAALALTLGAAPHAGGSTRAATSPLQPLARAEAPLFAGGGTPLSNGLFFPGTQLCVGATCDGEPYEIARGTDIRLYNLDLALVANAHGIVSKDRKKSGAPLFSSDVIGGPGSTVAKTSHLKPGIYEYYCRVHGPMAGIIEVTP